MMEKAYELNCILGEGGYLYVPLATRGKFNLRAGSKVTVLISEEPSNLDTRRDKWVNDYYTAYRRNSSAFANHMGEITTVAVNGINKIGISRPCKTDKYDEKVGLAVAYAKVLGHPIPNFI